MIRRGDKGIGIVRISACVYSNTGNRGAAPASAWYSADKNIEEKPMWKEVGAGFTVTVINVSNATVNGRTETDDGMGCGRV